MNDDLYGALASFRAAGATHVVVLARDYASARPECREIDGTVYPIEHVRRERPLPLSPACDCCYVPLVVHGLGPRARHVLLGLPLRPVRPRQALDRSPEEGAPAGAGGADGGSADGGT